MEVATAPSIKPEGTGVRIVGCKSAFPLKWTCRRCKRSEGRDDRKLSKEENPQKSQKSETFFSPKVWKKLSNFRPHHRRFQQVKLRRVCSRKCWYKFYWRACNKLSTANASKRLQNIRKMWFCGAYGASYLCWKHRTGQSTSSLQLKVVVIDTYWISLVPQKVWVPT